MSSREVDSFVTAAFYGDLAAVKRYVKAGGDVDARDFNGWTALQSACRRGQKKVVKFLLQAGADSELQRNGANPLGMATRSVAVMKLLLDVGVDINGRDAQGATVAMKIHGDQAVTTLEFLAARGCNLDLQAENGDTALISYVRRHLQRPDASQPEAVKMFIDLDVDLNLRNKLGYTAVMYAADIFYSYQESPDIHFAGTGENAEKIMTLLLSAGASEKGLGDVRFGYEVSAGNLQEARRLLEEGVNINLLNYDGYSPIYGALSDPEMLDLLLTAGADASAYGEGQETVLNTAIEMKLGLDVIQRLVEAGADPNAEGHFGNALEYAARLKDKSILKYLKAQGAKNAYATKRGLETEERNQSAILVQADLDAVTQALARLLPDAEHHPDIQNKTVHASEECYVAYQLTDHAWTNLHPATAKRGESVYGPDLAKKLSKSLATKVIFYENDDSAAYTGYQLFENGQRTEDVFLGSADLEPCFLWKPGPNKITDADDDLIRARSSRRDLSPEDLEDDDFFDQFFREQDAYLPAWSERDLQIGKTKRYFGKIDREVFVRVDFFRKV